MIRLRSVTLREIRLQLREPFIISSGEQNVRRILLLELEDADGDISWSECVAGEYPNYSPETIDTAWHALTEWLVPSLMGEIEIEPEQASLLLSERVRGHEMAKAAVEMGIWALKSKKIERSLAELIGGVRADVPVGVSLGIQPTPAALVAKVGDCVREGYRKIKVKIRPGADFRYIEAIREEFSDGPPLAVDANSAYRPSDLAVLKRFDAFKLLMIEQPLQHDDLLRHADLQQELATPICLDESIWSAERAEDMIRLRAAQIVNIKPGRVGGFTSARAIHDLCAAKNIPVWCGGMLESGIGRAYNVALASLPNFTFPGDLSPSRRYWERDIVRPEWTMTRTGEVAVPRERPGIGVDIDRDYIDDLTHRVERIIA